VKRYASTSWLDPRVVVGSSPIEGRGLFAPAPIENGEVVMRLGGEVVTDEEFRARRLVTYSSLAIGDGLNLLIGDASPVTFGNHSCDASPWMADEVTVTARRHIGTGEELTVDYALQTADLAWSMECRCGLPRCRGTITNEDWRRDVQERYAGQFSPFLNQRIAALGGS